MDGKHLIRVLIRRGWLLVLAFVIVFTGTYYWTSRQTRVYESRATFVIRPRAELEKFNDYIRALDMISNRAEINATFAEMASSKLIRSQVIGEMKLSASQQRGLSVGSNVIGGVNILEITVESRDPVLARDFADAVGEALVAYVDNLNDVYQIEALDAATLPEKPIRPTAALNLTLGAFLGIALGISAIFIAETLKPLTGDKEVKTFNIIDRETGAYNKSYLGYRLFQEMARAKRAKLPLSLGLIKVSFNGDGFSETEKTEALRTVKILTEKAIREEDILARFNGDIFAIVFPDLKPDLARNALANVRQVIDSVAHDMDGLDGNSYILSHSSMVAYMGDTVDHEELLAQAYEALKLVSPDERPGI